MSGLKVHPLADLFPPMTEQEYRDLVASIKEQGLVDPIIMFEDQILDGRNRARACAELGIKPSTEPYKGDDALGFVKARNYDRRHLDASQRALVAARYENMRHGGERQDANLHLAHKGPVSRAEAAKTFKVSPRSVADAKCVLDQGSPALVRAVETGDIKVSTAKAITALPPEQQERIAKEKNPKVRRAKIKAAKKSATESKPITKNTNVRAAATEFILGKLESAVQSVDEYLLEDGEYAQMLGWFERLSSCNSLLKKSTARYASVLDRQRRAAEGALVVQVAGGAERL